MATTDPLAVSEIEFTTNSCQTVLVKLLLNRTACSVVEILYIVFSEELNVADDWILQ